MRYKKATETTQVYLESQPLPNHGKTYTVVSHKSVIDNTLQLLKDSGFTVQREIYRANMNANVAQGIYHIYPTQSNVDQINNETELGMMFAWTNSYDRSKSFQCAIGAYVMVCSNGMMCGDMMNFKRKHTGTAGHDIVMQLSNQIKKLENIRSELYIFNKHNKKEHYNAALNMLISTLSMPEYNDDNLYKKSIFKLLVEPIEDKTGSKIHIEYYRNYYLRNIYKLQNKDFRKNYINSKTFSYKAHTNYFKQMNKSMKLNTFIIKNENNFVGYIKTFDKTINTEVSIAIKKEYQNKGIATKLLKYLVTNKFFLKNPMAKINKNNLSSINAFKQAGFKNLEFFK